MSCSSGGECLDISDGGESAKFRWLISIHAACLTGLCWAMKNIAGWVLQPALRMNEVVDVSPLWLNEASMICCAAAFWRQIWWRASWHSSTECMQPSTNNALSTLLETLCLCFLDLNLCLIINFFYIPRLWGTVCVLKEFISNIHQHMLKSNSDPWTRNSWTRIEITHNNFLCACV